MTDIDPYSLSRSDLLEKVKILYKEVASRLNWPSTFSGCMDHIELLRREINHRKDQNESNGKGEDVDYDIDGVVCIEDSLGLSLYCQSPISETSYRSTHDSSEKRRLSKRRSVCLPKVIDTSDDDDDDDDESCGDKDLGVINSDDEHDSDDIIEESIAEPARTDKRLPEKRLSKRRSIDVHEEIDTSDDDGNEAIGLHSNVNESDSDDVIEKSYHELVTMDHVPSNKRLSKRRSVCLPKPIDTSDDDDDEYSEENDSIHLDNDNDDDSNIEDNDLDYGSAPEDIKSDVTDDNVDASTIVNDENDTTHDDDDDVIQINPSLLGDDISHGNDEIVSSDESEDGFDNFLATVKPQPKHQAISISEDESDTNSLKDFVVSDDNLSSIDDENNVMEEIIEDKENTNPLPEYPVFNTPRKTTKGSLFKTPRSTQRGKSRVSVLSTISTPRTPGQPNTPSYKQHYKKNKEIAAVELFSLFNRTVFDSQLPEDCAIVWNKRLLSTAGYCYSFREENNTRRTRIELSIKVCDRSERLRDTLIHEMCHAAAWVIDGKRDGHGPSWKRWAAKANAVHKDLLPIATCHKYDIVKKYTYRCLNASCCQTYGRHSKSIDVETSTCSRCGSPLELMPPMNPDGTPKKNRMPNKFALHVKENYSRLKTNGQGLKHFDIMKRLADSFRSHQNKK